MNWRDIVRKSLWVPGITRIDIDEVQNRVRVGVVDLATRESLLAGVQQAGLPPNAIVVEIRQAAIPEQSVRDRFRPIPAGVLIQDQNGGGCSVGVNAVTGLGTGFVTASHCTGRFGSPEDGWQFHQNVFLSSLANLVGYEAAESDLFPCSESAYGCRYTDATFVLHGGSQLQHGTIVRTQLPNLLPYRLNVDSNNPRFYILDDLPTSSLLVGSSVHKMGQKTGWTSGEVTRTCEDISWTVISDGQEKTFFLYCQYVADYLSDGGDSGGSVFERVGSGNDVQLLGIHIGRFPPNPNERVFSYWLYITMELSEKVGGLSIKH
jgi:hypothetical protein